MYPSVSGKEVPRLLEMYSRALDDAAALPRFAMVPSRPSCWRVLRPLSALPRLTIGTHTLLVRHIDRNLATLIRCQSVKEALGGLTEEQRKDLASCMMFRNSLPPARIALVILAMMIPATVIALFLSPAVELASVPHIRAERFNKAFQGLAKESLNLLTAGGGGGLITAISDAIKLGLQGVVAVVCLTLVTSYLVSRPLVSAFRLKRQILCLADQDVLEVQDTASSWFVNKSIGAYAQERWVSKALQLRRPPIERPLDLANLAFPALCLMLVAGWVAWVIGSLLIEALLGRDAGLWLFGLYLSLYMLIWLVGLSLLRFKWLRAAWSGRQSTKRLEPPLVHVTSNGDYVESRPVIEAAAWPLASGLAFLTLLVYPVLGVMQFNRLARTGDRLRAEIARRQGRSVRGGHPLLATVAFASVIATPIVVSVHLWRLCALLGRCPTTRKYRTLAILACLQMSAVIPIFRILSEDTSDLQFVAFFVYFSLATLLYPLLLAAIQRCQNRLAREFATPVPYGRCDKTPPRRRPSTSDRVDL